MIMKHMCIRNNFKSISASNNIIFVNLTNNSENTIYSLEKLRKPFD